MKNLRTVFLCCQDPVVSALLVTFLSRIDGVSSRVVGPPSGKISVYNSFHRDNLYILDADSFDDPKTFEPLLSDLLAAGSRAAVLCSFDDLLTLPVHENLLRLDKPFRLEAIKAFVENYT